MTQVSEAMGLPTPQSLHLMLVSYRYIHCFSLSPSCILLMELGLDVSQWQTLISQRPGPLEHAGVLHPPVCPDQVPAQVPGADSFLLHHLLHGLHDDLLYSLPLLHPPYISAMSA